MKTLASSEEQYSNVGSTVWFRNAAGRVGACKRRQDRFNQLPE
ncbi:MAG: hypothetical protein ACPL4E_09030 [Thermoproteota archaeon]